MRALLVCLVVLSTALAGCHEPEGNGGTEGDGPGDDADAVTSGWLGDTESGIQCRLVQPRGPIAVDDEAPVRVEYVLADPDRFRAVELELGNGLARVAGALRETDPGANQTIEVALQPLEEGEYVVQAYVVWTDEFGGGQEGCGAFDVAIASDASE